MTITATVVSQPITAAVSGGDVIAANVGASSFTAAVSGGIGPAGAAGSQGPAGPAGVAGARGETGSVGPQGPAGVAGAVGPAGPAGATGAQGVPGVAGAKGDPGERGATGPAGEAGAQGIQGVAGATGSQGIQGPAGVAGQKGDTGDVGPQGIQGVAGAAGAAGAKGDRGDVGPAGATGAQGPQGVAGAAGSVGPQGPAGATGAAGPAASLNYASITNFPATGSNSALYLAEDTSRIYQWESPVYVEVGVAGNAAAHASTHATGGVDALTPSNIGAFSASGGLITGNVEIGSVTLNGLRYLDVSNGDTNANSGSIVRIISLSVDGTRAVPVNLVKYKNGLFAITNVDSDAAACITLGNGNKEDVRIASSGVVGVGTPVPTLSSGVGIHSAGSTFRLAQSRTPASSTATGNTGELCWDASYVYVCVSTNTWRRIAHSTW